MASKEKLFWNDEKHAIWNEDMSSLFGSDNGIVTRRLNVFFLHFPIYLQSVYIRRTFKYNQQTVC
jgi:hypothetical protein